MSIQVEGADELATALFNLSKVRYEAVALISAKNIYNRGVSGGTPVDTGELRESMSMQKESNGASVGYFHPDRRWICGTMPHMWNLVTGQEMVDMWKDSTFWNAMLKRKNLSTNSC